MNMPIPMPSPRGTNREGLFLPAGSPAAAYDASPAVDIKSLVMTLLKNTISDDSLDAIGNIIDNDGNSNPDTAVAADDRAIQPLRPTQSFEEMFPGLKRFIG